MATVTHIFCNSSMKENERKLNDYVDLKIDISLGFLMILKTMFTTMNSFYCSSYGIIEK